MSVDYMNDDKTIFPSRSSKNSKLYREVYGKYENLDNLPIEDNTDEIDMEMLRELVYNNDNNIENRSIRESLELIDVKKRNFDNEKMHDINKILEKAKYENSKIKEATPKIKQQRNILSTLKLEPITKDIINNNDNNYQESDNMYMTREFKFKELNNKISELNSNPLIENVMPDSELSLDLFEDLKPTENTVVTKPIIDSSDYKGDIYSSDTRDIDIIKSESNEKEEEFFTSSYEFSKKDFNISDQDDFFDEENNGSNVLKIILLLLAVVSFIFVIVYFVINYGMGV